MQRRTFIDGVRQTVSTSPRAVSQAATGLRTLTPRQWAVAAGVAVGFGVLLGLATVLIPNSLFARDIPPVWWNYPVWIATSVFSGLLFGTYVRDGAEPQEVDSGDDAEAKRSSHAGMAGAFLAWFAVGCPVCNKFALLALGYSGAITWFAPVQPFLAVIALVLTGIALVVRLRGRVVCALPSVPREEVLR
ncbi:MAG: hypothetical protein L0H20_12475 [Corynebacterium sp.]|uniref:hypothetical protein n=1 Tax=Corynebacterium sp. TaxID=1720 RepID=UPI00264A4160|nr:hypothetical protein [Corynebacterium sp.]MDN5723791.1 hypothetical protein [Corynebacterium sp.]